MTGIFSAMRGLLLGALFYASYGLATHQWSNAGLIAIATTLAVTSSWFAQASNAIDARLKQQFGSLLAGRLGRLLFQWLVNIGLIAALGFTAVINLAGLSSMGGLVTAALIVTAASQGFQYLGQGLSRRGIGSPAGNIVAALTVSLGVNALAVSGRAGFQVGVTVFSIGCSVLILAVEMARAGRAASRSQ